MTYILHMQSEIVWIKTMLYLAAQMSAIKGVAILRHVKSSRERETWKWDWLVLLLRHNHVSWIGLNESHPVMAVQECSRCTAFNPPQDLAQLHSLSPPHKASFVQPGLEKQCSVTPFLSPSLLSCLAPLFSCVSPLPAPPALSLLI